MTTADIIRNAPDKDTALRQIIDRAAAAHVDAVRFLLTNYPRIWHDMCAVKSVCACMRCGAHIDTHKRKSTRRLCAVCRAQARARANRRTRERYARPHNTDR